MCKPFLSRGGSPYFCSLKHNELLGFPINARLWHTVCLDGLTACGKSPKLNKGLLQ